MIWPYLHQLEYPNLMLKTFSTTNLDTLADEDMAKSFGSTLILMQKYVQNNVTPVRCDLNFGQNDVTHTHENISFC